MGKAALAALCALLLCAPAASASNKFTVYGCGTPESPTGAVGGWTSVPKGDYVYATPYCDTGDGFFNFFFGTGFDTYPAGGHGFAQGEGATWTLDAPAGLEFTRLLMDTEAKMNGAETAPNGRDIFYNVNETKPSVQGVTTCKADSNYPCLGGPTVGFGGGSARAIVESKNLEATEFVAELKCYDANASYCTPAKGVPLEVNVYRTETDLAETPAVSPNVANVSGALSSDATLKGVEPLLFDASDVGADGKTPGSGVYQLRVVVGSTSLNVPLTGLPDSCKDARPGNDNAYEFEALVPCPTSGTFQANVDTTRLPEGTNNLTAIVEDAAGNGRIALSRTVSINNTGALPPPDNGVGASRTVALTAVTKPKRPLTAGRKTTVAVKLVGIGGIAIPQAVLGVEQKINGAFVATALTATTDITGVAKLTLPAGPSRTVRFTYRAAKADPTPTATVDIPVQVRGRTTFTAKRKGNQLTLSGLLGPGPLPKGGIDVVVEVQVSKKKWQQFTSATAKGKGHWKRVYKLGPRARNLVLRARVKTDSAWPYFAYTSPQRRVR